MNCAECLKNHMAICEDNYCPYNEAEEEYIKRTGRVDNKSLNEEIKILLKFESKFNLHIEE